MRNNKRFEILTPSGWSDFIGVRKKTVDGCITINNSLTCTKNHLIKTPDGFVEAGRLKVGDTVLMQKNESCIIKSIDNGVGTDPIDVYDATGVFLGSEYYTNEYISHNCDFLGSSNTLIATWKIKELTYREPIFEKDGVKIYYEPRPEGVYIGVCDIAEGVGGDYSTMCIIDISSPGGYKIVATFRDNTISTLLFPDIIYRLATDYNEAWVLIEVNSIGKQVADSLHSEFEYENILMTTNGGRRGQTISSGFGSGGGKLGVKTTTPTRRIGCSTLKTLIEENKLHIESFDLISELATFVYLRGKYQAESGHHDDLTMCLVLFAWLTQQSYFRELVDIDIRHELYEKRIKEIEEDLVPFGFIDDGRDLDLDGGWTVATDFLPF